MPIHRVLSRELTYSTEGLTDLFCSFTDNTVQYWEPHSRRNSININVTGINLREP